MDRLNEHHAGVRSGGVANLNPLLGTRSYVMLAFLPAILSINLALPAQQPSPAVMAGTRLRVEFKTAVGTDISRVDDGVEVHLIKPVEAEGREVLPVNTVIIGRVLAVRKGDTHKHVVPMLRLDFQQAHLPDGRTLPIKASVAGLGLSQQVDSEGTAIPTQGTKADSVATGVEAGAAGAGIGAIAGGGKGAIEGGAVGAGISILGDILTRNANYWDFRLNKGRKAWLRLDADLMVARPGLAESPSRNALAPGIAPPASTAPLADTLPVVRSGTIYVEPVPRAHFYRVNEDGMRRDISRAGILLVDDRTRASLFLRVWNDSHGFHGELCDRERVVMWVGSTHTQSGLVRSLVQYMTSHGLAGAGAER